MLWVKFAGWFQCRLATDPDPTDEPRGVSGYMRAVVGEPDLDRVIRFQQLNAVPRSHCPSIGVYVTEVIGDARTSDPHPLVGATVDLLDGPKFEGRNHATARDGYEAIYPFHICIVKGGFILDRKYSDTLTYPPKSADDSAEFARLQATGINFSPGAIADATKILDLADVWRERCKALQSDLAGTQDPIVHAALRSRIASMSIMDANGPKPRPANAKYFGARMLYTVPLQGAALVRDADSFLPGKIATGAPWACDLWMGAWDADAMSGYTIGYLGLPVLERDQSIETARVMRDPRLQRG